MIQTMNRPILNDNSFVDNAFFTLPFHNCDSSHRNLPVVGWLHLEIKPEEDSEI